MLKDLRPVSLSGICLIAFALAWEKGEAGILTVPFLSFALGYILGGIPFGYLLPRLKGIDIRNFGSGNIGFTNVARNLGFTFALPVFILDFAKGFLPTIFAGRLGLEAIYIGLGAVLGHIFTPYLGFRGGRGVATTFGVVLSLFPKIFLFGAFIWLVAFLFSSYASLASLLFSFVILLSFLFFTQLGIFERLLLAMIPVFIILRHLPNIRRLIRHSEPKSRFWAKK